MCKGRLFCVSVILALAGAGDCGYVSCDQAPTSPNSGSTTPPPPPEPDKPLWIANFHLVEDCWIEDWRKNWGGSPTQMGAGAARDEAGDGNLLGVSQESRRDLYTGMVPRLIVKCDESFETHRVEIHVNGVLWWEEETTCEIEGGGAGYRPDAHRFEAPEFVPPDTGRFDFRAIVRGLPATSEPGQSIDEKTVRTRVSLGDLVALAIRFDDREMWPIKADIHPPRPTDKPLPPDTISVNTPVTVESASWIHGTFKDFRVVVDCDGAVLLDESYSFRPTCYWSLPLNELREVSWTPTVPGDYTFTLTLNPDHRLREADYSNNVVSRVLTVTP